MKKLYSSAVIITGIILVLGSAGSAHSMPRESRVLTVSDAEKLVKEYIINNTPWEEEQIRVKNISIPNKVIIPAGSKCEITPAPRSSLVGRTAFSLDIDIAGRADRTSWISADIAVWVDVVLTSRALKYRQHIGDNDIYIGRKNLADLPAGYIYDMSNLTGKRVKRLVGANKPLTQDILEEPPLFKRGEKVFIVAESEALKVTVIGKAAEDGYRGRPVKVLNLQSRKEVFGEVIDGGTVSVLW